MDKKHFAKQIDKLVYSYPNWKFDNTNKDLLGFWYKQFQEYTAEEFEEAVEKYKDTKEYPPTIAGLKKIIEGKKDNPFSRFEVVN